MSLIRSFLIDFGRRTALRAQFYANYFCAVHELKLPAKKQTQNARRRIISSAAASARGNVANKKSIFYRVIRSIGIFAAMLPRNGVRNGATSNSDVLLTIFGDAIASLTHTIK